MVGFSPVFEVIGILRRIHPTLVDTPGIELNQPRLDIASSLSGDRSNKSFVGFEAISLLRPIYMAGIYGDCSLNTTAHIIIENTTTDHQLY